MKLCAPLTHAWFMRSLALLLLLCALAPARRVCAEDAAVREAREWFERGLKASRDGAFEDAVAAFERSRALAERPSVLRNLAVALDHLGRTSEALAALERALELGVSARDAKRVADLRAELLGKVAEITFEVSPAEAQIEFDGRTLSQPSVRCDAGKHALRVTLPGHTTQERELVLAKGARRVERIELTRSQASPVAELVEYEPPQGPPLAVNERHLKPWAFGMLSAGIAFAGTATAAWVLAGRDEDAWSKRCERDGCTDGELARAQRQIDRLDRTSFALFGLAGASAVCATTLFVLHGREQKSPVSLSVGPKSVHLSLRF
jgi:hypothetical protein